MKRFTVFILFLFLLNSCALFQKKKKQTHHDIDLKTSIPKICLSGEGKGRMQGTRDKVYFNFEAINNLEEKQWAIAFSIPLYGEEILRLDWSNPKTFKAKGKLVKRLYTSMGSKKHLMIKSFKAIVSFLNFHHRLSNNVMISCAKSCEYNGHKINILQSTNEQLEFNITGKDGHGPKLNVKAFDFDSYYRRLELNLDGKEKILSLSLFYSTCQMTRSDSP